MESGARFFGILWWHAVNMIRVMNGCSMRNKKEQKKEGIKQWGKKRDIGRTTTTTTTIS